MKIIITLLISLYITSSVIAQDLSSTSLDRMMLAYTFYIKQASALNIIGEHFPDMKEDVRIATHDWNREFKASIDNIDTILTQHLKDVWIQNRNAIVEKYTMADYSGTQEKDAHQFITTVMERAIGKIESPILETFLINKPNYKKFPEMEISDGYSQKLTTHNWNKSLPINIILVLPKSWNHNVGNKKSGTILQTFVSENGEGPISMTIAVERGRVEFTSDNIKQQLQQDYMQKMYVKTASVINHQSIKIDGRPAAGIRYYLQENKKGVILNSLMETYVTYFKSCRIIFTYTVSSAKHTENMLTEILEHNERLIQKITDNVVILSQWGL